MSQLTYRLATLSDFEDLYRIKCDKENIAWGGFTKAPEKDSFYQWYLRQLASDCRWIYLVYEGEDCCGFFYVDKLMVHTKLHHQVYYLNTWVKV